MKRREIILLTASHLVVGGLAVLLARGGIRPQPAARDSSPAVPPAASPSAARPAPDRIPPDKTVREWGSAEFASAWNAVRTAKLGTNERVKTQRDLLGKWAEVDLEAALHAALDESWAADGDWYGKTRVIRDTGPLLDALSKSLSENPDATWSLIQRGDFGVAAGMLRRLWMIALSEDDPRYLASKLPELGWRDLDKAMLACHVAVANQSRELRAGDLYRILKELPPERVTAEQLFRYGCPPYFRPEESEKLARTGIASTDPSDTRMLRFHGMVLARGLYSKSASEVEEVVAGLPPAARDEALLGSVKNSMPGSGRLTGILDLMIRHEAWDVMADPTVVAKLRNSTSGEEIGNVALWAACLPVRKETEALFDAAVTPYLRDNPDTSAEWIGQLPSKAWRDRAYVRYVESVLTHHRDAGAARWAHERIQDPGLKGEAEKLLARGQDRAGK